MRSLLARIPLWVIYVGIAVGAVLSYRPARELLIMQEPWLVVVKTSVTVNFLLLLFLWGMTAEKATKGMSKRKAWLFWAMGLTAILLVYRFVGGHGTIFG